VFLVLGAVFAHSSVTVILIPAVIAPSVIVPMSTTAFAQCPEEPPLQNWDSPGTIPCQCFIPGEQVGVVFTAPAGDYPLEILRVGIYWASTFGGAPQSLEQAIHIYAGGLPNPGAPVFSSPGPMLTDGVMNVFDFEPLPGQITINQGPFTLALEILNQSSGAGPFVPSVVYDSTGCQAGQNVVFQSPVWHDACVLGVTGDWVMEVVYKPCSGTGIPALGARSAALLIALLMLLGAFAIRRKHLSKT
jgi:hypothetical protein